MTPEADEAHGGHDSHDGHDEHRQDHEHHLFHHHSRSRSRASSSGASSDSSMQSGSRTKSRSRSRSTSPHKRHHLFHRSLDFPFKENTIARRAQAPGPLELSYQLSPERPGHKPLPLSGATTPAEEESPKTRMDHEVDLGERIRKGKLAQRLQEVFGLEEEEEVVEELACWLLRNSLLKGYMFLTAQRICFFAHLPEQDVSYGARW